MVLATANAGSFKSYKKNHCYVTNISRNRPHPNQYSVQVQDLQPDPTRTNSSVQVQDLQPDPTRRVKAHNPNRPDCLVRVGSVRV